MNIGARRASTGTLVLLNDDCVCDPDFVERLIEPLDPATGVVMTSGVLRDWRFPELIDSAGMELDGTLLVYDYLNGEPLTVLARRPPTRSGPRRRPPPSTATHSSAVGGFDERLFAYWEDVDLVLKMLEAGGRCRLAPGALGTHEHSATLGSGSKAKNYLTGFGRGYVLRKWSVVDAAAAAVDRRPRRRDRRRPGRDRPDRQRHRRPDPRLAGGNGTAHRSRRRCRPAAGSPYFRNLQRRLQRRRKLGARSRLSGRRRASSVEDRRAAASRAPSGRAGRRCCTSRRRCRCRRATGTRRPSDPEPAPLGRASSGAACGGSGAAWRRGRSAGSSSCPRPSRSR